MAQCLHPLLHRVDNGSIANIVLALQEVLFAYEGANNLPGTLLRFGLWEGITYPTIANPAPGAACV